MEHLSAAVFVSSKICVSVLFKYNARIFLLAEIKKVLVRKISLEKSCFALINFTSRTPP